VARTASLITPTVASAGHQGSGARSRSSLDEAIVRYRPDAKPRYDTAAMDVTVVDHPLAQHLLTRIRDRQTPPPLFRELAKRLTTLIVLEAVRRLPSVEVVVETPLEPAHGRVISPDLVAVPILRGATVDDAQQALQAQGLNSTVVNRVSDQPAGTVVDTDPPAGTQVPAGTEVTLFVATPPPSSVNPNPSNP